MRWTPQRIWDNADVFVIGGGPSLRAFDWSQLHGKHTIGCNAAFLLGSHICKACFFSDFHWFTKFEDDLSRFPGPVFTHCNEIDHRHPWVIKLPKEDHRLATDGSLFFGYGGCSGGSAIHLALLFGAKRVILLGFDGKLGSSGESNWHNRTIEPPDARVYDKFKEPYALIAVQHPIVFPGTEIINCTPGSQVTEFRHASLDEVLNTSCFPDAQLLTQSRQ